MGHARLHWYLTDGSVCGGSLYSAYLRRGSPPKWTRIGLFCDACRELITVDIDQPEPVPAS